VRVISGRFKGRRLHSIPDRSVRPATDRVKQTLFDTMSTRIDLEGTAVLDLFAGTGSLGLEALSRGAKSVTFVDSSPASLRCIEENLRSLGCAGSAEIVRGDAMAFLQRQKETFDLIFADPPYAFTGTPLIPSMVFEEPALAHAGYLLIEHTKNVIFHEASTFRTELTKKFGSTVISFIVHNEG